MGLRLLPFRRRRHCHRQQQQHKHHASCTGPECLHPTNNNNTTTVGLHRHPKRTLKFQYHNPQHRRKLYHNKLHHHHTIIIILIILTYHHHQPRGDCPFPLPRRGRMRHDPKCIAVGLLLVLPQRRQFRCLPLHPITNNNNNRIHNRTITAVVGVSCHLQIPT